jgi:hypothetical protein
LTVVFAAAGGQDFQHSAGWKMMQLGLDGAKVGRDWTYVAIRQYHCARLVGQSTLWRNQSEIYVANAGFGGAV